jgi:hypothetical protein
MKFTYARYITLGTGFGQHCFLWLRITWDWIQWSIQHPLWEWSGPHGARVHLTTGWRSTSDIHLEHVDRSAVVEHSINLGCCNRLHRTAILSTKPKQIMGHIIREMTELNPTSINREDGFCLVKSWKPLICSWMIVGSLPHLTTVLRSSWGHRGIWTLPLSGHKVCPHWALTSVSPDVPASFCYLCTLTLLCMPATHLTSLPCISLPCPTHHPPP